MKPTEEISIDIWYGRMDTPEEAAHVKKLYRQLKDIERDWKMFSPAPVFKITQDKFGQVHVKMNRRMLMHLLMRCAELEDLNLQEIKPEPEPPEWFMKLMAGEPYEHLKP